MRPGASYVTVAVDVEITFTAWIYEHDGTLAAIVRELPVRCEVIAQLFHIDDIIYSSWYQDCHITGGVCYLRSANDYTCVSVCSIRT